MKKIIRFYAFASLLAGVCLLASCKEDETNPVPPSPPAPGVLAIPSNVACEATATSLSFKWDAVANAASYSVELRDTEGAVVTASVTTAVWTKDQLAAESEYEFRLKALPVADSDKYSESPWSEWAAYTTSEGLIASKFSSGDGSKDNPYVIKTPGQLALLAKYVNDEEAGYCEYEVYYKLGADIDLKDYDPWTPIGIGTGTDMFNAGYTSLVKCFRGDFNGSDHTISNLKVELSGDGAEIYAGLFGINVGWIEAVDVKGRVSAKSMATDGRVMAGGICGFSSIAYGDGGASSPLNHTGGLVDCSFTGSVKADANTDLLGQTVAAGICGYAASGNVDNAVVKIESGNSIHSVAGYSPAAGGVVGFQNGGRVKGAEVTVAGDIIAEYLAGAQPSSDESAMAGGVLGGCYRLQDANAAPGLFGCKVVVSGNIKATGRGDYTSVAAAGIAGVSASDVCAMCEAEITGNVMAEGESVVYAGGLFGSTIMSGQESQLISCSANIKGTVSAKQIKETPGSAMAATAVGGLVANAAGSISWCSVVIDGRLSVSNASTGGHFTHCGGLAGYGTAIGGSNVSLTKNGVIEASAKTIHMGGVCGFFAGKNVNKQLGNYSILEGKIKTHPGTAESAYAANIGGVAGYMNGSRVGVNWQNASMYACYSVFKAAVETESGVTLKKGVIAAAGARFTLGANYWWSSEAGMFGFGVDSAESATNGVIKLASLDQAGFETAIIDMNETLINNNTRGAYMYDAAKGYPVMLQQAQE